MLDYSIRDPSPLPYHLGFMVGLTDEMLSSRCYHHSNQLSLHTRHLVSVGKAINVLSKKISSRKKGYTSLERNVPYIVI
jgi:hypothetical protein